MTRVLAALSIALSTLYAPTVFSAELVFVEIKGCVYCIRFDRQMAPAYATSEIGKRVPLRRVDLMRRWPDDLKHVERPPYTPVFILVEDGREIGRFLGYRSPRQFNRDLRLMLQKAPLKLAEHLRSSGGGR
ncbi:transcriptional regulator [Chelativorans sp. AA-79]|uniref:transcriptional regulator n=1 Tax=Chelativorans sp. AA-79 TaxID=3028735 RepID=UPI0023F8225E|nr:transcriptional regulator [Chelativorans sp. AA-79]WEX09838.1 transcriptional regulator [Chelativorans sp. AA-79]